MGRMLLGIALLISGGVSATMADEVRPLTADDFGTVITVNPPIYVPSKNQNKADETSNRCPLPRIEGTRWLSCVAVWRVLDGIVSVVQSSEMDD